MYDHAIGLESEGMMEKKVVVIGSLNYDVCLKQEHLPEEGETCFADSVEYCSGGKGANQAVQASKLGIPVYMVGCIGRDQQGEFLKTNIERYGVCTDYLKRVDENSGMSVAQSLYDGGVRASVVKGSNDKVAKEDVDALDEFLHTGDIVVLQLEIPIPVVEYAIRFCKERGCYVILNGAPAAPIDEAILKLVNLFVVNELEAEFYCGREIVSPEVAVEEIRKMTVHLGNICIYTLGKAGSVVCSGSQAEFVPAKEVQAVESTGAGDSFIGGLCYALTHDMDIFSATRFATCCSAKTVCKTGGQPAMPTLEEVMELYHAEPINQ
ncbi:MAG: ribokinase [Lacrimispora sp.]|uniref:ribokinase n=1 Tax=Lacrimispora sp. TaxID=2719234 RepID=UPI0039E2F332